MLEKVCEVMQEQRWEQARKHARERKQSGREERKARWTARSWRRLGQGVAALGIAALLSGCGIFGCGGSATNGAAFGGCGAGMRF
jgi:hypothetical protein